MNRPGPSRFEAPPYHPPHFVPGRISEIVLATPSARALFDSSPPNKSEGRRSADRRIQPLSALIAARQRAFYLLLPACGGGWEGGALASRRSAADSPARSQPPLAQPRAGFPETRLMRASARSRLSQSNALRVDRSFCRPTGVQGRPGAGLRNPPAGTAARSTIGPSPVTPLDERDLRAVTYSGTIVKRIVPSLGTPCRGKSRSVNFRTHAVQQKPAFRGLAAGLRQCSEERRGAKL
jgi:hypothetical protein